METEQQEPQTMMFGRPNDAEFLKYLLNTADALEELIAELEGKGIHYDDKDRPFYKQIRTPLVNQAMRNRIVSILKTYHTTGTITTDLREKEINTIVNEVAKAVVDTLYTAQRYNADNYQKDPKYLSYTPSFLMGAQQQILLLVEHSLFMTLKRSNRGITLNKVTGMHSSQEIRQPNPTEKRRGLLRGLGIK